MNLSSNGERGSDAGDREEDDEEDVHEVKGVKGVEGVRGNEDGWVGDTNMIGWVGVWIGEGPDCVCECVC
jgi:hypothetical protein